MLDDLAIGGLLVVGVAVVGRLGRVADHAYEQTLLARPAFNAEAVLIADGIHFGVDFDDVDREQLEELVDKRDETTGANF